MCNESKRILEQKNSSENGTREIAKAAEIHGFAIKLKIIIIFESIIMSKTWKFNWIWSIYWIQWNGCSCLVYLQESIKTVSNLHGKNIACKEITIGSSESGIAISI